jgi:hypothetical protein
MQTTSAHHLPYIYTFPSAMQTYINPLLDWAFRYIFGSNRSAGVLRNLLNS